MTECVRPCETARVLVMCLNVKYGCMSYLNLSIYLLRRYTFDRLGHAFKPGVVVKVSILPLLIALLPSLIVVAALVIIHVRAKYSSAGQTREVENARVPPQVRDRDPAAVAIERQRGQRGLRERIVQQVFRVEGDTEDDGEGEAGEGEGGGKVALLVWWWGSMKESHEFLAIFDRRQVERSVSLRLVFFLCSLNSQLLGVTMFYFLHVCYSFDTIFDGTSMPLHKYVMA